MGIPRTQCTGKQALWRALEDHERAMRGCHLRTLFVDDSPFSRIRVAWQSKKAAREQTVAAIANRYREPVDLFERADTRLHSELSDRTARDITPQREA
jgi:hypothetical protein